MKLCRYDDDRLGVVRGDLVHDVTPAQRVATIFCPGKVAAAGVWLTRSRAQRGEHLLDIFIAAGDHEH